MQIDELTEAMARAMDGGSQNNGDAVGPSLPPARAANAGKTVDEVWADLNKSPLFMTELEENDDTAALQALDYEGTPLENGGDFKVRGNECFKVRGYVDAKEFYTKGILILAAEERKRAGGSGAEGSRPDDAAAAADEGEVRAEREMLEALYVNRAACHLGLENYRSCWLDCAAALRLNPRNVKACYRSARALLAVDRVREADDVCARGLAVDADNPALRAVAADIVSRARALDALRRRDAEREARDARRAQLLAAALAARGIPTRSTGQEPDMGGARVALVPDPDDPRSALAFPTVLLYPLHLESDFIQAFGETQALDDHLAYILPLPWDRDAEYTPASVSSYVETRDGGLLKVGRRAPLLKLLSTGKVEVVDDVLRIFVVPTAKADEWVAKFKAQRAAERGGSTK